MTIEPYLHMNGEAEQAMHFYEQALGARIEMKMRFSESPEPVPDGRLPAGFENRLMHGSILLGNARVMLSDGGCISGRPLGGFSLSLSLATESEARRAFDALSDGGHVQMPMGATFWSSCFGTVTDRFGVQWMVTVDDAPKA